MSADEIQRVIAQLERANVLRVSITGGEPFVRDDLFNIIERLLDKKILVHQIYSNGLLITDELLQEIKNLGLAPDFHLSFDGCGVHDRMRDTQGTEQQVLDAIQRIRAAGFQVVVATSIDRAGKGCLPETYERMKALQVRSWQVAPPNRTGNWCVSTTNLSLLKKLPSMRRYCAAGTTMAGPFICNWGPFSTVS
jgi:MoaA/NifB/PqqE/SkfB family radical SAM enzyme